MRKHIKGIFVYILAFTVTITPICNGGMVKVMADGFDGDIIENPWGNEFNNNEQPKDLDVESTSKQTTTKHNAETTVSNSGKKDVAAFKKSIKTRVLSATKAKKNAKKAKIVLKKVKKAKGYQVQYSTNKKFKKSKTITKKFRKNKITIRKLKTGKKYYVRARTYGKYKGKIYYSSWSKKKVVKVKKIKNKKDN